MLPKDNMELIRKWIVAGAPENSGSKVVIPPDGGDAWAPTKPRPDETLIHARARAHRWKRMLEKGRYRSAAEIAEVDGVTRSFVNRLLRLTLAGVGYSGVDS